MNNWHRELNKVFNLNFEVFGSEGDVSDRKTNAFKIHNLLIASIDTLKRPARKEFAGSPEMGSGGILTRLITVRLTNKAAKTKKTQNYKLAEALRDHARDLILFRQHRIRVTTIDFGS